MSIKYENSCVFWPNNSLDELPQNISSQALKKERRLGGDNSKFVAEILANDS
jgi:hypothetical protein